MTNLPFKSIFVPCVPSESGPSAAVPYAAGLARKAGGGHLTVRVLGARIHQPFSFASAIAGGFVQSANEATQREVDAAVAAIVSRNVQDGFVLDVKADVREHAELASSVGYLGRLHDLSVTDRLPEFLSEGRAMLEELLFSSGRPVIVVPPDTAGFSARNIMVAWDGSARAARAMHDALPLLTRAEQTQIVCVSSRGDGVAGADIAPFLARHGVNVEIVAVTASDSEADETLLMHAAKSGADLIVMGAFSHSRFRQLVLGGVTQAMLERAPAPVFFSY